MSKVSLAGNASGTGIFTIASPNSNTDRTLTLPDNTGTLLSSSAQGIPKSALPTGSVLQVVQATYNAITSTTSASYVSAGLAASITPTSSSSKILILTSVPFYCQVTSGQNTMTIYRGATDLSIAGGAQRGFGQAYSNAGQMQSVFSACYLDSPATTSLTTYTLYMSSTNAAGTVGICSNNTTATMTLLEVAA